MSDHFVSEASTTYTSTTQEMNIHALSEIRARDSSNRTGADVALNHTATSIIISNLFFLMPRQPPVSQSLLIIEAP